MHANEVESLSDSIFELNNNVNYAKYAKFLMLPLDEAPFEINANSRQITIPDNFKKYGVSLHGDQIAETLLFRIDRFFDFNDLLTTTIFVQWTRPGSEPESEREGASLITLIDYDTEPGKLLLGWPLTSEITKAPGPLKFSLRFFKKDPETKKISYSFNTLTTQVTINPALHPDINDNLKIDEASSLFHQAITDSPSSGSTPAERPKFLDYGNLPTQAWVDDDDTLTFAVSSYTGDTGVLTYQWYKAKANVDEEGNYIPDETVEITSDAKIELRPTKDTSRNNEKAYFTKGNTAEGNPYSGNIIAGELDLQVVGVSDKTGEVIYERYSTYSVPASPAEIVGLYYVIASNRAGTSTGKQRSAYCEVPCPKTLVFEEKNALPKRAFIDNNGAIALTAKATPDDPAHANISYQWLKTESLEEELSEVLKQKVDAEGNLMFDEDDNPIYDGPVSIGETLALTAPNAEKGEKLDKHIGWYKVIATNVVNRKSMSVASAESNVDYCKVTGHPAKPTIVSPTAAQTIELVKGKDDTKGIFTLNIQLTDMHGPLYNESYTYNWFHSITEGDPVAVKAGDADIVSEDVNTGSLQVKLLDKDEVEFYYCEVSNNLNGETSLPVTTGLFKVLAQ